MGFHGPKISGDGRYLWRSMNVPPWEGTCKKFQEGRLLMQRYQFVAKYFEDHKLYAHHAEECRRKGKVLAGRMVEHARTCNICCEENRLNDENFYGVFK